MFTTEQPTSSYLVLQSSFDNLTLKDDSVGSFANNEQKIGLGLFSNSMPPQRRRRVADTVDEEPKNTVKRAKTYFKKSSKSGNYSESFSPKKCITLFQEYVSPDDPDVIGPEGMEKFCEDIEVEPENIVMLVLAWKMNAKQMGYFTLSEWLHGLTDIQCDSIHKIQCRLDYLKSLLRDQTHLKSIYRYAYDFARDKDQRSMDIETAKAMLQLLLGKNWPLYGSFHQFLEQSKYKVINKDQWCNVLEFSRVIYSNLSNYDEDGAWPVLLDEFVDWLKTNKIPLQSL